MNQQAELPPLELTIEDAEFSRNRGYLGPETMVYTMLACRERQLLQAMRERDNARKLAGRLDAELEIAYAEVKRSANLLDLVYVDADGENPNPRTWKEEAEAAAGLIYSFVFWGKRLLNESEEAQNCGDHCRNSCRWCGLRNAVEEAEKER